MTMFEERSAFSVKSEFWQWPFCWSWWQGSKLRVYGGGHLDFTVRSWGGWQRRGQGSENMGVAVAGWRSATLMVWASACIKELKALTEIKTLFAKYSVLKLPIWKINVCSFQASQIYLRGPFTYCKGNGKKIIFWEDKFTRENRSVNLDKGLYKKKCSYFDLQ